MRCSVCGGDHIPKGFNDECISHFQERVRVLVSQLHLSKVRIKYLRVMVIDAKKRSKRKC